MIKKILQLIVVLLFTMQGVMAQTVDIHEVTVAPGDITVPVDMLGFTGANGDVAAITLSIEFDSDLMDFAGIDNMNPVLQGGWLANYMSSIDRLVITYTATDPFAGGDDIDAHAFDLLFYYKGGFSSDLVFDESACEVNNSSLGEITTTYLGGSVTQSAAVGTASMAALVDVVGSTVSMPVDMAGAAFDNVASLTFVVAYDDFRLSYSGIVEDAVTGVVASASNGILTITWDGGGSFVDLTSHHLFDMQFVYHGGNAEVAFAPGCEVNDDDLSPLAVDYFDGVVTPVAGTASLTISSVGSITDTVPVAVGVPVVAADFGTEVLGAVTLNIEYDATRLTYTGYTKQQLLTGWTVNAATPGLIEMQWANPTGATLTDGNLLTLNFMYGTMGGNADIAFFAGSIVKDPDLVTIPVSFFDGSVASNSVDGKLTYLGDVARPIYTSTVYLRNSGDASIAYTTSTDLNGDYTFTGVANGSYFLDAATTIDGSQAYDVIDAYTILGLGGTLTGLQQLAANVNETGGVDIIDAYIVWGSWGGGTYVKVSTWTAPEWIFENPALAVSSDVTLNFSAICSGDANGSFAP